LPNTQLVTLPDGRKDPAETLAGDGPQQLADSLDHDTSPLAGLVVDDILDRWPAPTSPEYRIGALHEAAPMLATLPADQREEQIVRVASRLTLDSVTVTDAVIDHVPAAPVDEASPLGLPQRPVLTTSPDAVDSPLAGVATEELRERVATRSGELVDAGEAARVNAARIGSFEAGQLVRAEQDRQRQVAERAAAITTYRADRDLLERLRSEWIRRDAEISAAERRIADGGRRAARQETGRLEELRRLHESTAEQVRSAGARMRELEPHVGDPAQQERTLAAAAEVQDHGDALIAAVREQQERELADRQQQAPRLEAAVQDAHRDVDQLTDELYTRPDAVDVPAPEEQGDMLIGRGPSSFIASNDQAIGRPAPDLDRDIER